MQEKTYSLGIDIGSTTVKTVLRENDIVIYEKYERHMAEVRKKTLEMLDQMRPLLDGKEFCVALTGSARLVTCPSSKRFLPRVR